MADFISYGDSLLFYMRGGTAADPYVDKTDTKKIINGTVVLEELPDPFTKVTVSGYNEVFDATPSTTQFAVNYQYGLVTFHSSKEGVTVALNYKGRGRLLLPAERVYLHGSENPDLIQNVQGFVDIIEAIAAEGGAVVSVNGKTGIATLNASDIPQDANNRFVTDVEKTTWNNAVEEINNPLYSTPLTTTDLVTHLPSTVEKGRLDMTLAGRTLTNFISNGNVMDTTGWTGSNATLSALANILKVTLGNTTNWGGAVASGVAVPIFAGKKVLVRAKVKVADSVCQSIAIDLRGSASGTTTQLGVSVSTPASGAVITLSGIITLGSTITGNLRPIIRAFYADSATANGKIMEVQEVLAIDLDAHPIFAGMTADQINAAVPTWFDATKSAIGSVRSVGKNSLPSDMSFWAIGNISTTNGSESVDTQRLRSGFVSVRPNQAYRFSTKAGYSGIVSYEFDSAKKFIKSTGSSLLTTDVNTRFVRMIFRKDPIATISLEDVALATVQLEKDSTATAYAPYVETSYAPATELRSLPNLVKDTLTADGMLTRRVKETLLVDADIGTLHTALVNIDVVRVTKPIDYSHYNKQDALFGTYVIEGFPEDNSITWSIWDNAAHAGRSSCKTSSTLLDVFVPKGTYASLAAAKSALVGRKMVYQLATPTTQNIGGSVLIAEPSGTIYAEPGAGQIQPELTYKYPLNIAGSLDSVTNAVGILGKGVISESLTNANGTYIRWADGTQICHNSNSAITIDPATFIGTPTSIDSAKLKIGRWKV